MAGTLRSRSRRNLNTDNLESSPSANPLDIDNPSSDIEEYSKEVLASLIKDNLPPTPNNFSLYFDRLLEDKTESFRKQISSMLELEEGNDAESTLELEHSLKQGFSSIKNILATTAHLYKNMTLMTKILDKRVKELADDNERAAVVSVASALENDVAKLNAIVKKQSVQMKTLYDETASIVKSVENETIFDNKFGVYNKRYLLSKIEKEIGLIKEFKHKSSLIMIELSRELKQSIGNEKALLLMTRTIARLLLKTSRRSDTVAHYGNGVFAMLLKHTDINSAIQASDRLCYLVSNSNFFFGDREIKLQISIGITDINLDYSVEETIVSVMNGVEKAYNNPDRDYEVVLMNDKVKKIMNLCIVEYPDKRLRNKSIKVEKFDSKLHNLLDAMYPLMLQTNGIGLAAIQVGVALSVLILNIPDEDGEQPKENLIEIINPVLTNQRGETTYQEGCLSVPSFYEDIDRFEFLTVNYQDRDGNTQTLEADGLLSIAIQHEYDHLQGVLFIDKLTSSRRRKFEKEYKKMLKEKKTSK